MGRLTFGYCPDRLELAAGPVQIEPLSTLRETVAQVKAAPSVDRGWIYAPGGTRVFCLPRTHAIVHASADGEDHLAFHLWALSFFTGMRLTATEAGFLDATPIKPGKLVDFLLTKKEAQKAIALAEAFWVDNRGKPERARLFAGAVHALFLAQSPKLLDFERFMLLYTAFDTCWALAASLQPKIKKKKGGSERARGHGERLSFLCRFFRIPRPAWAVGQRRAPPEVVALRNATIHEGLFQQEPLGFALAGTPTGGNLIVELEALICRLLAGLLGAPRSPYVRTPIGTRQTFELKLS